MALSIGTAAPDFTLTTAGASGPETISLADYRGKQSVVLLFFPMAFTGVCTEEMCSVSQGLSEYNDLNVAVLGISGDNPFAQKNWAEKENITMPLLSDYEHEVAAAYDVAYDTFLPDKKLFMGGVAKRSAFIVDKEGVIQYAESHEDPHDLPDFSAVKAVLAKLG